jgi:hypothetical protein
VIQLHRCRITTLILIKFLRGPIRASPRGETALATGQQPNQSFEAKPGRKKGAGLIQVNIRALIAISDCNRDFLQPHDVPALLA